MEVGLVKKVDLDHEMQQSYLDYAMSVIVARALPDARDGLKPVQRRILYAMHDMGLRPDSAYKKSARIVGEVLGKYHPHGDMAVYEAMARMAQEFSMRYPLVDGQGNFGSVDGDPPAAMRYTEARLKSFAIELLNQIDRSTVDFNANFDDSLQEPVVLPAAVPNLLVSGSTGIAVGMATSIPPHNLGEVVDALLFMLQQWEKLDDVSVSDLMRFIKGPDFPTGGVILQDQANDLLTAYATGRGRITVRGQVHTEDTGRGRSRLIITELPYMANKASLIERVAELVREGDLEGISDLRDESDRQGMRIVVELSKVGEPDKVLRELYRRTPLESTFGIILLALVDGEPRLLTLKQALKVYLEHRMVVVRRRSEHDLAKARQRAHLLEGLRIAINFLDEVIKIIRAAADVDQARERLIKRFKLSEIQAQAILDMPLRRLAALERKKIEQEYKDVLQVIKDLESLLKSPKKMRDVVGVELDEMKASYADRRRTRIVSLREGETAHTLLTTTDLTSAETVWVGISPGGYIARTSGDNRPENSRWMLRTNTHHTLYLVAQSGQAAAVAVHALPQAEDPAEGAPLSKASPFLEGDRLAGIFSVPARNGHPIESEHYVVTLSEQGLIKKSAVGELPGPSSQRFTLTKVNADDNLIGLTLTGGTDELLLATTRGMAIRFAESEVRAMGLVAAGVNAVKLAAGDRVIGIEKFATGAEVFLLGADGNGWRLPATDFPLQGRYGQGVIACRPGSVAVIGLACGNSKSRVDIYLQKNAPQDVRFDAVPLGKRPSPAKKVITLKTGDAVAAVAFAWDGLGYWEPQLADTKPQAQRVRIKSTAAGDLAHAQQPGLPLEAVKPKKVSVVKAQAAPGEKKAVTRTKTTPKGPVTAKPAAGRARKTETATAVPAAKPAATSRTRKKTAAEVPVETKSTRRVSRAKTSAAAEKPKTTANKEIPVIKPASTTTKPKTGSGSEAKKPAAKKPAAEKPAKIPVIKPPARSKTTKP